MERCICMSINELKRLEIVIKVIKKRLIQTEAADILDVSVRQVKLSKKISIRCMSELIDLQKRKTPSN